MDISFTFVHEAAVLLLPQPIIDTPDPPAGQGMPKVSSVPTNWPAGNIFAPQRKCQTGEGMRNTP
jgi:hypothetical protein